MAATAGSVVGRAIEPGEAEAYHFCGHIYTTGSCVHPPGRRGSTPTAGPLKAENGKPDRQPRPRDQQEGLAGRRQRQRRCAIPTAARCRRPRTKVCEETARQYSINAQIDGAWYRCCGGTVRKLVDCCSQSNTRINGDARSRATASRAARSSASCTSRRRSPADGPSTHRRARVAGLLIGATGTWSPCGFSMVETIGPTGHTGGLPTTLAACATFLPAPSRARVFTFGGSRSVGAAIPGEAGGSPTRSQRGRPRGCSRGGPWQARSLRRSAASSRSTGVA